MGERRSLLAVLFFNAITAILGGIGLLSHSIMPPPEWLTHLPFHTYFLPGLVLLVIVGGSSLVAAYAVLRNKSDAGLFVLSSGFIMLAWIIVQMIIIQQFNWLQGLYLLTGSFVIIRAAQPNARARR